MRVPACNCNIAAIREELMAEIVKSERFNDRQSDAAKTRIATLEKRFKWLCYGVVAATIVRLAVGV